MKQSPNGSIYRITCLKNGKVYIGLTRGYVSNRWHQHKKAAAQGASSALYSAMRRHGVDAFEVAPIASALSVTHLANLERILIAEHGAYGSGGYNMSLGGESGYSRRMTDEGKARIRAARNRPEALESNRERNRLRMSTDDGKAHQARMVDAARLAGEKLAASRRRYAATPDGAAQVAAAAALGAKRKAELSSKAVLADGVMFKSVQDAALAHGIERGAVRWRIKSPRFQAWEWA